MLVIAGALFGGIFGAWRAKARGGKRSDILLYAVVHAMILALAGLFATLIIHRGLI